MAASAFSEAAPAKINLALHVVGRRADGYHLLDTIVVFADRGDRLSVAPRAAGIDLAVEGPFAAPLAALSPTPENLAFRAARLLADAARRPLPGVGLTLDKQLPLGAGLGGGSADAAATLRLLNRFWALGFSDAELAALGLPLGADIPMCLAAVPLCAGGVGEILTPLPAFPALALVLVHPGVATSTAAVFRRLRPPYDAPLPTPPVGMSRARDLAAYLRTTGNTLRHAARVEAPAIGHVLTALVRDPDCLFAQMSGSGSACFGLFAGRAQADVAAARISRQHPEWWVAAAMTGATPSPSPPIAEAARA